MIPQIFKLRFGRYAGYLNTICLTLNDVFRIKNLILLQVVFEPDPSDPTKTTSLVATCGGNSICIIDVNSGTVLMKYKHKDIKENFYTLAW